MLISTMAALALVSGATAQSTVSLFLVNFDTQPLVGSIIASDATATTYTVGCRDPGSTECGCPPNFTFTQGPSTIHYSFTESRKVSETNLFQIGCIITSSDHAVCTNTRTAFSGTLSTTLSLTSTLSGTDLGLQAVTITAAPYPKGTASVTSASSTSSSSSSSSLSRSSTTQSSAAGRTTAASSSATAASAAGNSSSSNGAAPMVTGKAQWLVGGAAAALALAAL